MFSLAIIADDLTGALDTCVQFAQWGAKVKIASFKSLGDIPEMMDSDVVVVNAQTRHLTPEQSYDKIFTLTKRFLGAGALCIYIKTDSGLRGNVDTSLLAALDAAQSDFLPFIPAYPDMERVTRDGIHIIEGLPLSESVFGSDPFNPVHISRVKDLFLGQSVNVVEIPVQNEYQTEFNEKTVGIFDAETNADLSKIARHLKSKKQLKVMAGCAGFAAVLPELLGIPRQNIKVPKLDKPLTIFCGSLSPITRNQIEYSERVGSKRIVLTPRQQMDPTYLECPEGIQWLDSLEEVFKSEETITVDTGISSPEIMEDYLTQAGIGNEQARVAIGASMASLMCSILQRGYMDGRILMVIGGDTLHSFLQAADWHQLTPLCEVGQGAVLSQLESAYGQQLIISKSGGFGRHDLLEKISRNFSLANQGGRK